MKLMRILQLPAFDCVGRPLFFRVKTLNLNKKTSITISPEACTNRRMSANGLPMKRSDCSLCILSQTGLWFYSTGIHCQYDIPDFSTRSGQFSFKTNFEIFFTNCLLP